MNWTTEKMKRFTEIYMKGLKIYAKIFPKKAMAKVKKISNQLTNCQKSNSVDYEKYFIAKTRFNILPEKLEEYKISLRLRSKEAKIFEEVAEFIWKAENYFKKRCIKKDTLEDLCLHFDFSAYTEENEIFSENVKADLKLTSSC